MRLRVLLALGVLACISVVVRRVRPRHGEARAPWLLEALEHGAMACLLAAASACVGKMSPTAGSVLFALGVTWVALDAVLFVHTGLRLQLRSLLALGKARGMAPQMPWGRHILGVTALAVGVGWCAGVAGRAPASWMAVLFTAGCGGGLLAAAAAYRLRLPMAIGYGWNPRFVVWLGQRLLWRRAKAAQTPATPGEGNTVALDLPAADLGRDGGDGTDGGALPPGLVPQLELGEAADPKYPLLRRCHRFTGEKHFDITLGVGDTPHVVWLFLESFRAADTGALGNTPYGTSLTPCFDALARQGVLWRDFYANGTITSLAMLSALYGVLPPLAQRGHQQAFVMPPLIGMPQIMAERGYLPAYFCDGPLDWEDKRMFSLHQGFRLFYGAPSIKEAYPDAPETVWHFRDEFLMRFHVDWLAAQTVRGRATFSSLLTVSNHFPWKPPPDAPNSPEGLDPDSVLARYMRTTMYTDGCLGLYMNLLRQRGLYEKTIFLILGDHAQQVNDANDVSWSGRYTSEGVRVPCLLLAPGRLANDAVGMVIDEIASQVDLLPTFMDIFNAHTHHHTMGTSLMRRCKTREAISVHPWAPGMAATRFERWRHVFSLEAEQSALYDVQQDPREVQDVRRDNRALAARRDQLVQRQRQVLHKLYQEERLAPPQDKAYLRDRFGHSALDWFPRSLEDCRKRLQSLRANLRTEKSKRVAKEISTWMLALDTAGLTDDERLEFAQLLMARLYIDIVGEMTDEESARLAALEPKASTPESMPLWDRAMVDGARPMAHTLPGQFFRGER